MYLYKHCRIAPGSTLNGVNSGLNAGGGEVGGPPGMVGGTPGGLPGTVGGAPGGLPGTNGGCPGGPKGGVKGCLSGISK